MSSSELVARIKQGWSETMEEARRASELRRAERDTPLLVLTGSDGPADEVLALNAGADDYLVKPFKVEIFIARIRALMRRGGARHQHGLVMGNLVLNRLRRLSIVNGVPLRLTARELALLEQFMLHANEVLTRTELLEKVLEMAFDPGTNVVDVHVSRLRRKLRDAGASVAIASHRGIGFELIDAGPAASEGVAPSEPGRGYPDSYGYLARQSDEMRA